MKIGFTVVNLLENTRFKHKAHYQFTKILSKNWVYEVLLANNFRDSRNGDTGDAGVEFGGILLFEIWDFLDPLLAIFLVNLLVSLNNISKM